jgi:formylglycine-generating enzyme required for sulfatase activity
MRRKSDGQREQARAALELELAELEAAVAEPGATARGDAAFAAGDLDGALRAWTEALAAADQAGDEAAKVALAGRLSGLRRRVAWRRLAAPAFVLVLLLPTVAATAWRFAERAEVERRDSADRALAVARADVVRLAPEAALEALADVALRYPGTPAADAARTDATDLASGLARARSEADEAQALVARGALAQALPRFDAAMAALVGWPDLPLRRLLERRREEVTRGVALSRAKAALERREPAAATELLEQLPADDDEAERARSVARYAEVALAAEAALERQDLGAALPLLREANGLAPRAGEAVRDLAPLEATWRELRRLRARARLERGTRALADGDLAGAKAALTVPTLELPDEAGLAGRLAALAALAAAGGVPDGMVLVPGGRVVRGDVLAPDELPLQLVDVAPLLVDRREVTRGQVQAWLQASGNPAPPGWKTPATAAEQDEPARGLSWSEASAYAAWAGKRLLTETEWECAARLERTGPPVGEVWDERAAAGLERLEAALAAGVGQVSSTAEAAWLEAFAQKKGAKPATGLPTAPTLAFEGDPRPAVVGDDVTVSPACAFAVVVARRWPWGAFWDAERCAFGAAPAPAGKAGASPWGVEELAGGVAEWTSSEYRPHDGPLRAAPDGKGRRVVKGGSFRSLPDEVRTTARAAYAPEVRFDDLGFRCARSIGAP